MTVRGGAPIGGDGRVAGEETPSVIGPLGLPMTLADLPPLRDRLLFVGLNPSPESVAAGHYLQGRLGRTFWRRLMLATVRPAGTPIATADDALVAEGHVWVADGFGSRVLRVAPGGAIVEEIAAPDGMGVYACALGGDDGRTLLMCCAPDFYEHTRAPVREAVLVSTQVAVPHAGLP